MARENIVVLFADDTAVNAMRKMDYANSFPSNRWHDFDTHAIHCKPYCLAERATLLTGRFASSHGAKAHAAAATSDGKAFWNNYQFHNLIWWLRQAGYDTGFIGKLTNRSPYDFGDTWKPPGLNRAHIFIEDSTLVPNTGHESHVGPAYGDYVLNNWVDEVQTVESFATGDPWTTVGADDSGRQVTTPKYSTDKMNVLAREFVRAARPPFFLQVSFNATHGPTTVASRHASHAVGAPVREASFNQAAGADWDTQPAYVRAKPLVNATAEDDAQIARKRCIQALDEALRDIVTELQARNDVRTGTTLFDNTVIVVLSDNGYDEGRHRLTQKNSPFEGSLRNRVLVRHPLALTSSTNLASPAMVQTHDLAPTLLEVAQIRPSWPPRGQSLLPLLLGQIPESHWRQAGYFENFNVDTVTDGSPRGPTFYGVRTKTHKYVEIDAFNDGVTNHPAESALYDLDTGVDADELRNRVNDAAYASVKADLAARLARMKTLAAA